MGTEKASKQEVGADEPCSDSAPVVSRNPRLSIPQPPNVPTSPGRGRHEVESSERRVWEERRGLGEVWVRTLVSLWLFPLADAAVARRRRPWTPFLDQVSRSMVRAALMLLGRCVATLRPLSSLTGRDEVQGERQSYRGKKRLASSLIRCLLGLGVGSIGKRGAEISSKPFSVNEKKCPNPSEFCSLPEIRPCSDF